jgi:hypothetical protein
MKTTTLWINNSRNMLPLRLGFPLITLVFACLTFLQRAQAVTPAPDGGYPGWNTAEGTNALFSRTTGGLNTALGGQALFHDTTGTSNTAVGLNALYWNNGNQNVALGVSALQNNTTGTQNTANGVQALYNNTTGSGNTAVGYGALFNNTTDSANTAVGFQALLRNNSYSNGAFGYQALQRNIQGFRNNAFGYQALQNSVYDILNNAFGDRALWNVGGSSYGNDGNNAFGGSALVNLHDGGANTAIGHLAGESLGTGSGNVYIGEGTFGTSQESNQTYIRNINTTVQPTAGGTVDYVTVRLSDGRLGHTASSQRYKENIKPMDKASEVIFSLRPVTYRYNKEIDPDQNLDYGLVAEDVAKVDPKLAIRDGRGRIESVRYTAINAMLLNEFLKAHRKMEQQQEQIDVLTAQLKEQAALIQKVSDKVELNKPAPQTVLNDL